MKLNRRDLLKMAIGLPTASWLLNFRALAAPYSRMVKITDIKALGLDNLGDGCLVKVETDAGLTGYGEAGYSAQGARAVIELMKPALVGQDPLAIERHFYMMTATQYPYMAHVPTAGGVDIALWDLAGKITGLPVYRLLGGPIQKDIPVYSHGSVANMLDKGECRAWADQVKGEPEGMTTFKFGSPSLSVKRREDPGPRGEISSKLPGALAASGGQSSLGHSLGASVASAGECVLRPGHYSRADAGWLRRRCGRARVPERTNATPFVGPLLTRTPTVPGGADDRVPGIGVPVR
jgi:Mandelate racemase / muconate lactonizing enzyme, N-terminal domain